MENKIRQNAFVVFDIESCPKKIYDEFYKDTFEYSTGNLKLFNFLGEVPQAPGHCILVDLDNGSIVGLYHTDNFREANEDEC